MAGHGTEEHGHQDGARTFARGEGASVVEVAPRYRALIAAALRNGPRFTGAPVRIEFRPRLRARRNQLVSGGSHGAEVHAGSFLRRRIVVLDSSLLRSPKELRRILLHELFHFAWLRAGNPLRRAYEHLLAEEGSRGELGWSAAWRKQELTGEDRRLRTRRWREYACESFCDTGAWLFAGITRHDEYTLAARHCRARREWVATAFGEEVRM